MVKTLEMMPTENDLPLESAEVFEFKDADGDKSIGIMAGDYIVFATEQISGRWTINFALAEELKGSAWMDTITNKGAFSTMIELKPALRKLLQS